MLSTRNFPLLYLIPIFLLVIPASSVPQLELLRGAKAQPRSKNDVGRALTWEPDYFYPLTCNDALSVDDCTSTSSKYYGTLSALLASTAEGDQAVISCGQCVVVDTTDGSTLSFPNGLNVEGMLYFPSTANLTLEATHIFVQGILKMDPPDTALGNKVLVWMVGSDIQYLIPHNDNSHACDNTTGCEVGNKAIVVAGGTLDIKGLEDDTCPTWTKLQSVTDVPPDSLDLTGCELTHSMTIDDGTFESAEVGTKADGWYNSHSSGALQVAQDDDGNKYMAQEGRCCSFSGLGIKLDMECAETDGDYQFSFRYRTHGDGSSNSNPIVQIQPQDGSSGCSSCNNIGKCSEPIDGEWVTCTISYTMSEVAASVNESYLVIYMETDSSKDVDYDDIVFESLADYITVDDPKAAECWSARPNNEILVTNSESSGGWSDQVFKTIKSVDNVTGIIGFGQANSIGNPISLDQNSYMASEVAWLSRPIVFEAEEHETDPLLGGHLIILQTPDVVQHIEGVEIRNFGQQGELGKYPIHFHFCSSVAGSIVRKNVIRESNQRCVVIHGSHDILVEENVAFDSYGHCYILEDGGEHDNTFKNNLGARTRSQITSIGSTDNEPSTLWITNPQNHIIGNVCAGSAHTGIWFELESIRGDSAELAENEGVTPKTLDLYTFSGNTAHSNSVKGVTTYFLGYRPSNEALFEGISSYHNGIGLMIHGTQNVRVTNAFFGLNNMGVQYFANFGVNTIENSTFVGSCDEAGVKLSLEPRSAQVQIYSTSFSGYSSEFSFSGDTNACDSSSYGAALRIAAMQTKTDYSMPILSDVSFDSNVADVVRIDSDFEDENIFIEDPDGTMNPSGLPGFFVNNVTHMTTFIDSDLCSPSPTGSGLFCENTCLRRIHIDTGCCSQKNSVPDADYQMVVTSKTDSSKTYVFDKWLISSGLWYNNKRFDVVLPFDQYSVYFLDITDGQMVIPDYTLSFEDETNGDDPPNCEYITTDSIEFACPQEDCTVM